MYESDANRQTLDLMIIFISPIKIQQTTYTQIKKQTEHKLRPKN